MAMGPASLKTPVVNDAKLQLPGFELRPPKPSHRNNCIKVRYLKIDLGADGFFSGSIWIVHQEVLEAEVLEEER